MIRPYDIVTFDCYGTLIDWEGGITRVMREAAAAEGVTLERANIVAAHAEVEPEVQADGYRSYRDVLIETAVRMAPRLGWSLTPERATFLPESIAGWMAFEDTNPALERMVESGIRLGILSNIDNDLLAGTLRALTVEFDLIVTAEEVRSYKPGHGHFAKAREQIGEGRWLHAAQSYFHDIVPARELAIPVAWINRNAEQKSGDARPDKELGNLTELADWLI
jgi:2-haloacid dehalogenase/putative hydrolase of the HAD superfamily